MSMVILLNENHCCLLFVILHVKRRGLGYKSKKRSKIIQTFAEIYTHLSPACLLNIKLNCQPRKRQIIALDEEEDVSW